MVNDNPKNACQKSRLYKSRSTEALVVSVVVVLLLVVVVVVGCHYSIPHI